MFDNQDNRASTTERQTEENVEGPLDEAVLENSNQFYRWHSELEAAQTLETEEKYKEYAASLRGQIQGLDLQHSKVLSCLHIFALMHQNSTAWIVSFIFIIIANQGRIPRSLFPFFPL